MVEVSVIIPCFNDGDFIDTAIDSVRSQTFRDWEIIVVDDGSTDVKTLSKLSALQKEPKIKVFHIQNSGPSEARNFGVSKCQSRFILPLDADDKIDSEYLELATRFLQENPDYQIFYGRAKYFGLVNANWNLPVLDPLNIAFENCIYVSAVYDRKVWESINGYSKNMSFGLEDYDFWLRAFSRGFRAYRDDRVLFFYRIKSNSRSVLLEKRNEEDQTYQKLIENNISYFSRNEVIIECHRRLRNTERELVAIKSSYFWRFLGNLIFKIEATLRLLKAQSRGRGRFL